MVYRQGRTQLVLPPRNATMVGVVPVQKVIQKTGPWLIGSIRTADAN